VSGTPPCPNPDAEHCEALCLPQGSSVSCGVAARDGDGDGHGDPACMWGEQAGDDCNDAAESAHPGATEACDGIDNDCDGKVDLADGLSLSSTSKKFVDSGSRPDITWIPTKRRYGVSMALGTDVGFNAIDRAGDRLLTTSVNLTQGANTGTVYSTTLHWGGDELGLLWARDSELRFQRIDDTGEPIGEAVNPAPADYRFFGAGASVARIGDQDWLVFFSCCMSRPSLSARRIGADGTVREALYKIGDSGVRDQVRSVISGEQAGATWVHVDQSAGPATQLKVRWTRRDAELTRLDEGENVLASTESLSVPGGVNSVITSLPDGYVVAWFDGRTRIAEFGRDGTMVCSLELTEEFPAGSFPDFNASDMASGPAGYALVASGQLGENSYQVDVVHVKPGCEYVQRFAISGSTVPMVNPQLAGGGEDGFAAVWTENNLVYSRIMAESFCAAETP
jgi:hypothetical protein